ncbi:ubiquinone biosynthesis protein AarF [Rhodopirellula sallentina SM41]|uniref:Ubiquinone biosynthesis protein AarF n=2 Tax=Rhodopirellula TaxID=265488 RepID=M5TS64_9BACT|nr:ubiquinone biosynthesis protein AarF [Rhodopirellula sallentina SM41]
MMKLTSIPSLYRNLRRGREILLVLRRYGLADWLSRSQSLPFRNWIKDRSGVPLTQYSRVERIRMAITELGPTFIKVGQVLASRPDLVGIELADELKRLRGRVEPDTAEQVRATLRSELGDDFEKNFSSICYTPLATASIGQVHRAVLLDGSRVVLKVQRSGIDRLMRQDIEVLEGLAQLAARVDTIAVWGPREMVRQLRPMVLHELDFNRERSSLKQFADALAPEQAEVAVPAVVDHLCTRRVLVMEEMIGTPLASIFSHSESARKNESESLTAASAEKTAGEDRSPNGDNHRVSPDDSEVRIEVTKEKLPPDIGARLAKVYLKMVFEDGFFHADPHPGNLIFLDDKRLGILDFGMTGRIDETLRESIEEMLVAINSGDRRRLTRLIRGVGNPRLDLDQAALEIDVADFVDTYGRQSLDRFDLSGALNELTEILHRHGITLPNQSALLLKMLISLEGTLRELGVGFDSLDIVRTYLRKVMFRRLTPTRRLRQARRIYLENEAFLEEAPEQLLAVLNQTRLGQLQIRLDPKRITPSVNRLVLGLMASAVFLGSSLLLAYEVPPLLFPDTSVAGIERLSLLGLLGLIASTSVMTGLCITILSNNRD